MRINANTHPAYQILQSGNLMPLQIDTMFQEILDKDFTLFKLLQSIKFSFSRVNKRYYITSTFKDAIELATPKILDKNLHINSIPTDSGMFFTEKGFSIYTTHPSDNIKIVLYGFNKQGVLTTYAFLNKENMVGGLACSTLNGQPYNDIIGLNNYVSSVLCTLYFIHNCEIEVKEIKPKEKTHFNNDKYFNETTSNITVLDCRWFTDLVRNIPFQVKGHFRWQVHGEKNQKRKLIWIEEFEKHGYSRKATKSIIEQDNC
jgi:hypothetical protein